MLTKLKKQLPKTLFARTLMIIIVPVFLAQAFTIYMFYERHWDNVSKHLSRSLAGEISLVVNYVETVKDPVRQDSFLDSVKTLFHMNVITLDMGNADNYLEDYKIFNHAIYHKHLSSLIKNDFQVYIDASHSEVATLIYLDKQKALLVRVSDKRLLNSTTYIFLLWMVGTTSILLFIAIIFLKNQIRPIIRLARLANSLGRGQDAGDNFKPEGASEVRQAGTAFLNMKDRITRHIRQRTEMLAGISHDLRTPLTRMKLEIAMLQEKYKDENIEELSQDILEMQTMVESYINFVKADEEEETIEINLTEFLKDSVDKFKQQGFDVEVVEASEVKITAREKSLKRAITNLLENCKKYANTAKVYLHEDINNAVIIIDDDGPGIPVDERVEVFKPFHRIESSRSRDTGGTGLGLSIVRDVINGHGGSITLDEVPIVGGLRVIVKLPI